MATTRKLSDHIRSAISGLLERRFAEEIDVGDVTRSWRVDGDRLVGAVISAAGLAAINADAPACDDVVLLPPSTIPSAPSKISLVLDRLQAKGGATITELAEITGWLPHTTRAALTGLRKKGHTVIRTSRDGATCYHVAKAA